MIDKEHLEQAGLHALDLLEDSDRLLFERELRVNPHLRGAVREAQEHLAAVALTAPQAVPPARVWTGIESQLSGKSHPALVQRLASSLRRHRFQPGWAAAAALAVLSSWLGIRQYQLASRLADLELNQVSGTDNQGNHTSPANGTSQTGQSQEPDSIQNSNASSRTAGGSNRPLFGSRTMRPVGLPNSVQKELDRLRANQKNPAPTPEGVADLRIMEMHPPGTEAPAHKERSLLIGKVAEAIAAAASTTTPKPAATAEKPPASSPSAPPTPAPAILRGQGSSPSSDIIIEQGGTVNIDALNLHPDAQVVHRNFPSDDDFSQYGLIRIDEDRVWDGNGGIWHRQPDGHTYVGQKAPAGFQPPDPDDPGTVSAAPLRPAPANPVSDPPTTSLTPNTTAVGKEPSAPPEPYALPVIASDGQGMIVTQNLPEPAAGYGYALWSHDTAGGDPVLLGFLPQADGVNGVFAFDLPPGMSIPGGYRITQQALTDFSKPGSSILQGP